MSTIIIRDSASNIIKEIKWKGGYRKTITAAKGNICTKYGNNTRKKWNKILLGG